MTSSTTKTRAGHLETTLAPVVLTMLCLGLLGGCGSDPERPPIPGIPQLSGTIQLPEGFWLDEPWDAEVAPDGRLYILERYQKSDNSRSLAVLSADGVIEREIPLDMDRFSVGPDRIFTVDWWDERIDVHDLTGTRLTQFKLDTAQPVDDRFEFDVAAAPDGNVYVLDPALRRVQRFSPEGGLLATWGERGTGPAEMEAPRRIVVDRQGDVYVLDVDLWRVQKYSPEGALLVTWNLVHTVQFGAWLDGDLAVDAQGRPVVMDATYSPGRVSFLPAGGGDAQYWPLPDESDSYPCIIPAAIALRGDEILLVDYCMQRIFRLSNAGSILGTIGRRYGSAPGELQDVTALAGEPEGNVVVLDESTGRLERYAPDGSYLGPRPGPSGAGYRLMAAAPDGDVWLAGDWTGDRVVQASPEGTILHEWTWGASPEADSTARSRSRVWETLVSLAVAPEETPILLITTSSSERVELRTPEGELVRSLPLPRTYRDLAVDHVWRAWLIDTAGNILILNLMTGASEPFLGLEAVPGGVGRPKRIAFDGQDNLYILDSSPPRILVFDRQGGFAGELGREELAGSSVTYWGFPPFAVSTDGGVAVATRSQQALIYRP